MALDWTHQFCLACDRQVQVDDDVYCSEACRMVDLEMTDSTPSSQASSHGFPSNYSSHWSTAPSSPRPTPAKFHLSPAYDFNQARPYGSTPRPSSPLNDYGLASQRPVSIRATGRLTPSSSHSSLCSMQSTLTTSSTEPGHLSDKAKMELRAYAVSFEQVRLQRRRSY